MHTTQFELLFMYLSKLSLLNFKNYESIEINFCKKINYLTGLNGSGKTNLLDAIHYLALTKSFFNNIDNENIRHNCDLAIIQGIFFINEIQEEIFCCIQKNKKKIFKRNKNEYQKLSDHIGFIPLVFISPTDYELITDSGELKRKFINNIISQYNKDYLENLINYNKIVLQRNKVLKEINTGSFSTDTLDIYDIQLNIYGQKIVKYRQDFFYQFVPIFIKYYEKISNKNENVNILYESNTNDNELYELLKNNFEKDIKLGYTTIGPHKDTIRFILNNYDIRKVGSQGQQKTFIIALKIAQYEFLKEKRGVSPIILLDDIFDRLDEKRINHLISLLLDNHFGQIFITHTDENFFKSKFLTTKAEAKTFKVENNKIMEL